MMMTATSTTRAWNSPCYFHILRHASVAKCVYNTGNSKLCIIKSTHRNILKDMVIPRQYLWMIDIWRCAKTTGRGIGEFRISATFAVCWYDRMSIKCHLGRVCWFCRLRIWPYLACSTFVKYEIHRFLLNNMNPLLKRPLWRVKKVKIHRYWCSLKHRCQFLVKPVYGCTRSTPSSDLNTEVRL